MVTLIKFWVNKYVFRHLRGWQHILTLYARSHCIFYILNVWNHILLYNFLIILGYSIFTSWPYYILMKAGITYLLNFYTFLFEFYLEMVFLVESCLESTWQILRLIKHRTNSFLTLAKYTCTLVYYLVLERHARYSNIDLIMWVKKHLV